MSASARSGQTALTVPSEIGHSTARASGVPPIQLASLLSLLAQRNVNTLAAIHIITRMPTWWISTPASSPGP